MRRAELKIGVDAGLSIAQLAESFGCSKGCVRYWLARHGLKARHRSRRDANPDSEAARNEGLRNYRGSCPKHGNAEFVIRSDGGARCKRCRSEMVAVRRRRVKEILVEEAGGRCVICGYNRYVGGLAFHHVDPSTKVMGLANRGRALSIGRLREEARKCVLLCHNCGSPGIDVGEIAPGVTAIRVAG